MMIRREEKQSQIRIFGADPQDLGIWRTYCGSRNWQRRQPRNGNSGAAVACHGYWDVTNKNEGDGELFIFFESKSLHLQGQFLNRLAFWLPHFDPEISPNPTGTSKTQLSYWKSVRSLKGMSGCACTHQKQRDFALATTHHGTVFFPQEF